jgi:hypothetical protein
MINGLAIIRRLPYFGGLDDRALPIEGERPVQHARGAAASSAMS